MFNDNSVVRFRTNKSKLYKVMLIALFIMAYFAYLIYDNSFIEVAILSACLVLSIVFMCVRKGNFHVIKNLKLFFHSAFKKYVVDELPIAINVENNQISVELKQAEYIRKQSISDTFVINKNDIANILYYKNCSLLIINYATSAVFLKGSSYSKNTTQNKSSLSLYLSDNVGTDVLNALVNNEYNVLYPENIQEKEIQKKKNKDKDLALLNLKTDNTEKSDNQTANAIATPPGVTIEEQLTEHHMTREDFALHMNMSEEDVEKLINGNIQITLDVANKLELVLGEPASFWSNLENVYRKNLATLDE